MSCDDTLDLFTPSLVAVAAVPLAPPGKGATAPRSQAARRRSAGASTRTPHPPVSSSSGASVPENFSGAVRENGSVNASAQGNPADPGRVSTRPGSAHITPPDQLPQTSSGDIVTGGAPAGAGAELVADLAVSGRSLDDLLRSVPKPLHTIQSLSRVLTALERLRQGMDERDAGGAGESSLEESGPSGQPSPVDGGEDDGGGRDGHACQQDDPPPTGRPIDLDSGRAGAPGDAAGRDHDGRAPRDGGTDTGGSAVGRSAPRPDRSRRREGR